MGKQGLSIIIIALIGINLTTAVFARSLTHIAVGPDTLRAGVKRSTFYSRFDTETNSWWSVSHPNGFAGTLQSFADIELDSDKNSFILAKGDSNFGDVVMKYDPIQDVYTAVGERFSQNTVNDITIDGSTIYACGTFAGFVNGPDVQRVAKHNIGDTLWSSWEPIDEPPTTTIPNCAKFFIVGSQWIIADTTNTLFWKDPSNDWTSNAATAGSNLRDSFGNSINVKGSGFMYSGYLYLVGSFQISGGAVVYSAVRSNDGITFEGILSLPVSYGGVTINTVVFDGSKSYFTTNNGSDTALFSAPYSASEAVVSRVGSWLMNSISRLYMLNENQVFAKIPNPFVTYNGEPISQTSSDFNYFRYYRTLKSDFAVIDASAGVDAVWKPYLGGGVTTTAHAPTTITKIIQSDNILHIIGPFGETWDVSINGAVAFDNDQQNWVPLGQPLSDNTVSSGIDILPSTLQAVHHFSDSDGRHVFIGGQFRRINNQTMNSIAFTTIKDDTELSIDVDLEWQSLGDGLRTQTGVFAPVDVYHPTIGAVNNIISTPGNPTDIYVSGLFSASGDVPLSHVGRFKWGGENVWDSMQGGVNGFITSMDSVGRKVVVVGSFTRAGNITVSNIAVYDADKADNDEFAWSTLGTGITGNVNTVLVRSMNDIFVGGSLTAAGGVGMSDLAHWNGQYWEKVYCPTCSGLKCDGSNVYTCPTSNQVFQLKEIHGKIHASSSNGLLEYDGSVFRVISSSISTNPQSITPAPGSNDGGDLWAIKPSFPYFAEINSYSRNVMVTKHNGGFNNAPNALSSASSVLPALGLMLFALVIFHI